MPNTTGNNAGPKTKMLAVYAPLPLVKRIETAAVLDHGRSLSTMVVILVEEALKVREKNL